MPARLPDEKREAILASIRSGMARNDVAREHGVSPSTVTGIAREFGHVFDRSELKTATAAKQADNAALRALAGERLIRIAHELLDSLKKPHMAFNFGGKDNTYAEKLMPEPDAKAKQIIMTTAAIAIDKHVMLHRLDADPALGEVLSLLERMAGSARAEHGDGSELVGE